ncbi:ADP-ribosylation factor-like protein 9 [Microcaecilia unicolor]|uniref:ADP-ribosylation factor-like protein 9 n=1 Tax=Microcaecilia unicolor TaxID=1415580 RepID=A0A6P7XIC8_9AMPH|nr:ADP-ribosylation factor-like protein 9 [Microcaecilia unicolor]
MSNLRAVGLLGAAAALTGGVAYIAWTYISARRAKDPERGRSRRHPQEVQQQQQQQHHASATNAVKQQEKPLPQKQILVLGMDGAGKTSVLHSLTTQKVNRSETPTKGFNAVCFNIQNIKLEFLEIGGGESLRAYWNMYLSRALMLVYVVDAADHARLPVAKSHLHQMIQHDALLPVVVLANKQDLPGAYSITEMHDALALSEIGDDRKLFLIGTHLVKEGAEIPSSLQDARELIIQLVSDCQ